MPVIVKGVISLGLALVFALIVRWRVNWIVLHTSPREILYLAATAERNRVHGLGLLAFLKDWRTWAALIGYSIPLVLLSAAIQELTMHTARVRGWTVAGTLLGLYLSCAIILGLIPLMYARYRKWMRVFLREYLNDHGIPICRSCGYDLRGQAIPRCPECGAQFRVADTSNETS